MIRGSTHSWTVAVLSAFLLVVGGGPLTAQGGAGRVALAAPGRGAPIAANALAPTQSAGAVGATRRPSRIPYVIGGAVVGATIVAAGFALGDSRDAVTHPVVITIMIPAGALLGAGIGWLVHEGVH